MHGIAILEGFAHLNTGHTCVGGIVVSIAAFQAVDPGSIPGQRNELSLDAAVVMRDIHVKPPVVTRMSFEIPHSNLKVGCCWTDVRDGALHLNGIEVPKICKSPIILTKLVSGGMSSEYNKIYARKTCMVLQFRKILPI